MKSYTIVHNVISMMTSHNVSLSAKTETTGAGVEKVKVSANSYNFHCDLIKKMKAHTLCSCPLIRKIIDI